MLTIFEIRHGQDEDNANGILNGRRDKPLTPKGIQQANQVAQMLKDLGIHFDAVYTSPLQRARQTANTVASTLELPEPIILEELIERDFGIMTGMPVTSIEDLCSPNIIKTDTICYFLAPAGAETFPTLMYRAHQALASIRTRHTDGNMLLSTHGDIGKMIYAAFYGLRWWEVLNTFHFGNSEVLKLAQGLDPKEAHIFQTQQHNL